MFISISPYAQAPTDALEDLGGNLTSFLPLVLMFVVMYFLMIRPQQKAPRSRKR